MDQSLQQLLEKGRLVFSHPFLFLQYLIYYLKRFVLDIVSALGYYNYSHHIIFVVGVPKGGSTWMENILSKIPGYGTRSMPMPENIAQAHNIVDSAFRNVPTNGYTLLKTHTAPTQENLDCLSRNGVKKVLVIYRDLRDVAVSLYYHLLYRPSDTPYPIDYQFLDKEKVMNHAISVVAKDFAPWITGWIDLAKKQPEQFYFVRFEDLIQDTKKELRQLLHFYGIELSNQRITKMIEKSIGRGNLKSNLVGTTILPSPLKSTFRSGTVGSWRKEMTEQNIKNCQDLLGRILIELNYEQDLSW